MKLVTSQSDQKYSEEKVRAYNATHYLHKIGLVHYCEIRAGHPLIEFSIIEEVVAEYGLYSIGPYGSYRLI